MSPSSRADHHPTDVRDRRAPTRLDDPLCPECESSRIRVALRTTSGLYYRCDACGHLHSVEASASDTPAPER